MADKVILYTQDSCNQCQMEKHWLDENNVDYEERNIRQNQKYMDEVMKLNATATPVTVIKDKGEEEIVMGYDHERLALLLNI